jgi:hypothetical protein
MKPSPWNNLLLPLCPTVLLFGRDSKESRSTIVSSLRVPPRITPIHSFLRSSRRVLYCYPFISPRAAPSFVLLSIHFLRAPRRFVVGQVGNLRPIGGAPWARPAGSAHNARSNVSAVCGLPLCGAACQPPADRGSPLGPTCRHAQRIFNRALGFRPCTALQQRRPFTRSFPMRGHYIKKESMLNRSNQ